MFASRVWSASVSLFSYFAALLGHLAAFSVAVLPVLMPIAQVRAQDIKLDPTAPRSQTPGLSRSGNGRAVIDITRPNAGISHNRFKDFSAKKGLIFNNSRTGGQSVTGGRINANKRFGTGGEADVILNEVRGRKASSLAGLLEVFGKKAHVIIANENGVHCNSCSFLNTKRATLTSGRPTVNGSNISLHVTRGTVGVWGKGMSGADEAELIGRHVVINGKVDAKNSITASGGAQYYDYNKKKARSAPTTAKRTAPYAVDGTQFGAMKSGQIRIIGNESGLGVKASGSLSSSGDILLRSRGNATIANVDAGGRLTIEATGRISQPNGTARGKKGVSIAGQSFANSRGAKITSSGNVKIKVREYVNVSGEVSGKSIDVIADKKVLNLGRVLSNTRLEVVAGEITNKRPIKATYAANDGRWIKRYVPWMNWYIKRNPKDWYSKYYRQLVTRSDGKVLTHEKILSGGDISGRDVSLTAKLTDITNEGTIKATNSLNLLAKRDIVNEAVKERHIQTNCAWGSCGYTAKLYAARISSANTLSLNAGRDITNIGGVIDGQRSLSVVAGRDITNAPAVWQELSTYGQSRGYSGSRSSRSSYSGRWWWLTYGGYSGSYSGYNHRYNSAQGYTRHRVLQSYLGSTGGSAKLRAGRDIVNSGSIIEARSSLTADAGRDVSNYAATFANTSGGINQSSRSGYGGSYRGYYGNWGWWYRYGGRSGSYYNYNHTDTSSGETVRHDIRSAFLGSRYGNVSIRAQQDVINDGSTIVGGGQLDLIGGRDIINRATRRLDGSSYKTSYTRSGSGGSYSTYYANSWWWNYKRSSGSSYRYNYSGGRSGKYNRYYQVRVGTIGATGGNTSLIAGRDIATGGSTVRTPGRLTLDAGRLINLGTSGGIVSLSSGLSGSSLHVLARGSSISLGRRLSVSGEVLLYARNNITNRYGINAGSNVSLTAQYGGIYGGGYVHTGGDVNLRAYSTLQTGALTGRNISLSSVRGSLDLRSRIAASGNASLYAYRNITNRGGLTSGGDLSIYSQYGSINNPGSAWARRNINARAYYNVDSRYLAGGGKTSVTALYGSITNRDYLDGRNLSLYARYDINNYSNRARGIDGTYGISAVAGRDINNNGSDIFSYRNVSLRAGRNINLTSRLGGTSHKGSSGGRKYATQWWQNDWEQSRRVASVTGRGNVSLIAGGNINLRAAELNAGNTLALNARGNINSTTLAYRYGGSRTDRNWKHVRYRRWTNSWSKYVYENRSHWWYRWAFSYWNNRGHKFFTDVNRWDYNDRNRSWAGSRTAVNNLSGNTVSIRAGSFGLNGVNLISRGDTSLAATAGSLNIGGIGRIQAGRDLNVWARDNVSLAGGVTFGRNLALTAYRGALDLNTNIKAPGNVSLYAYRNLTNRNSISAGGNVSARSYHGSISNYGSIYAGRDLTLDAYSDVRNIASISGSLRSGRDTLLRSRAGSVRSIGSIYSTARQNHSGGAAYGHQWWQTNWQQHARASSINAGGNLSISAARDIELRGANLAAGGNIIGQASGSIISDGFAQNSGYNRLDRKWSKNWYKRYYTAYTGWWWWRRAYTTYDWRYKWRHNDSRSSRVTSTRYLNNSISGANVQLSAGLLDLDRTSFNSRGDITMAAKAGSLTMTGVGNINAGRDLSIYARDNLSLSGGVTFGRNLALTAASGSLDLNTRIETPGNVSLYAYKNLVNRNGIIARGNVSAVAQTGSLTNRGWIAASGALSLRANGTIDSRWARGRTVSLTSLRGNVYNREHLQATAGDVSVYAYASIVNDAAKILASNNVTLRAQKGSIYARTVLGGVKHTKTSGGRKYATQWWQDNWEQSLRVSSITGGGNLNLIAGGDIKLRATDLKAGVTLALNVGGRVTSEGLAYRYGGSRADRNWKHTKQRNWTNSWAKNWYSRYNAVQQNYYNNLWSRWGVKLFTDVNRWDYNDRKRSWSGTRTALSNLNGRNISINSGSGIALHGVNASARDIILGAGSGNVSLTGIGTLAASNTLQFNTNNGVTLRGGSVSAANIDWGNIRNLNLGTNIGTSSRDFSFSGLNSFRNDGTITARNIDLNAGSISGSGRYNAGGDIILATDGGLSTGALSGSLVDLFSQSGAISAGPISARLSASIDAYKSVILSGGSADDVFVNSETGSITSSGTLRARRYDLTLYAARAITNNGTLSSARDIYLDGNAISGRGNYAAGRDVDLYSNLAVTGGGITGRNVDVFSSRGGISFSRNIAARGDVSLDAYTSLAVRGVSGRSLTLNAETGNLAGNGTLRAWNGDIRANAGGVITANGNWAGRNVSLSGRGLNGRANFTASENLAIATLGDLNAGALKGRNIDARTSGGSASFTGLISAVDSAYIGAYSAIGLAGIGAKDASVYAERGAITLSGLVSGRSYHTSGSLSLNSGGGLTIDNGARLSAGRDLSIQAAGSINVLSRISGTRLIRSSLTAGRDLYLTSGGSILNRAGIISAGRNLVASAQTDIRNEALRRNLGKAHDYQAAQIKAGGGLILRAGRDIINRGSKILGREFVNLDAGRDIINEALASKYTSYDYYYRRTKKKWYGKRTTTTIIKHFEKGVIAPGIIQSSTGDVRLTAGRDLQNLGGLISAKGDLIINVGRNVLFKTKAVELTQVDHYSRKSGWFGFSLSKSYLKANWNDFAKVNSVVKGHKLLLYAGGSLVTQGAILLAEDDLNLSIGGHIQILAQKYKKYNNVKRGSSGWFGLVSNDFSRTHEQVLVNGSGLETGHDLDIVSRNGDVTFQSASLRAGNNITVDAKRGSINFLSERASEFEQTETYNSNGVWWKSRDKGHYTETVIHNHLLAGGKITFKAKNGIYVEYREGEGNLDATIASLARSPNLAWMAQLQGRNDVQWQAVKEAAEEWDHEAEGLTQAATAVIMLAVAAATGGAAGLLGPGFVTGTGLLGAAGISVTNGVAVAAINAGFTTIVSRAAVSLINNKGDLGAVFEELGSSDFLKSLATSVITAGVVAGLDATVLSNAAWGLPTEAEQILSGNVLSKLDTFGEDLIRASIRGTVRAGISTGINGGDLGENLKFALRDAAIDTLGAAVAGEIGSTFKQKDGSYASGLDWGLHKVAHGALGCAIGAAGGTDCASGAFGAVVGEVIAEGFASFLQTKALALAQGEGLNREQLVGELLQWKQLGVDLSKLGAGLGALAVGLDVDTAARTAGNAAENNALVTGTILFILGAAYTAYQGDGDIGKGLEVIADGSDPIQKALASGAEAVLDFAETNAPDQTAQVFWALDQVGQATDATVKWVDDSTGGSVTSVKEVSYATWMSYSETTRKRIIGAGKVLGVTIAAAGTSRVLSSLVALKRSETYYRAMSSADYKAFKKTGRIPATAETFISPTKWYADKYDGVLVKFQVKRGTTKRLSDIGVRDSGSETRKHYRSLQTVKGSKWASSDRAYFKQEGGINSPQVNIGLGRGKALDIFNQNILKSTYIRTR